MGIRRFESFRIKYAEKLCWPPTIEQLTLFIASLSLQGLSHSTASLYLCSIGFQCKIKNVKDSTKHYILSKILEGIKRSKQGQAVRLPITVSILNLIVNKLPAVCVTSYESQLFKTAFCLAFFGFFRIGEITVSRKEYISKVIAIQDVVLDEINGTLKINLRFSKTDQSGKGATIILSKSGTNVCPVKNMGMFLSIRPKLNGPLFCHHNGKPLTRYQFSSILKKSLTYANVNYQHYKTHSFRIGAATTAAELGHSVETIKLAGRWSSNAYKSYVQPKQNKPLPKLM